MDIEHYYIERDRAILSSFFMVTEKTAAIFKDR